MRSIVIFDIDGVIRDVGGSYRRALADTVEQFTGGAYRPTVADIDVLKSEGIWNNDWEASQELVYRYYEALGRDRSQQTVSYDEIVAFFQSRYRGTDPVNWNGYIRDEPLLVRSSYLDSLTEAAIGWGFFSGATRGSANYVLEKRLGLHSPLLVAMEDAPGKPDPTGLFDVVKRFDSLAPVLYAGDTVADMQTVLNAKALQPDRLWIGVGILPPHAQNSADYATAYAKTLTEAGAAIVLENIEQLSPLQVEALINA
ncbi:TIGR01548 family HAD-type hydrolase [Microcoleus sp. FACHB-1515]|uniref:TIGR01548 family HAD-type hydrolase n=1 Tax=Cyanophyceae TaxID=3028117 RepID=UPI0016896CDE|nr:TIGR01548 family HAD-type hydrolase [Microcoleus sp. FACHB-1515]MBD2092219.1 TIGR01548 family HAD-type hydrolase [Microcoleus sp. FACHB-1515]